eukprot:m.99124 g.99124  ORF g.99124 m.99124 type:complete len:906 (-) comp51437_c0_seq5:2417-5134(-)
MQRWAILLAAAWLCACVLGQIDTDAPSRGEPVRVQVGTWCLVHTPDFVLSPCAATPAQHWLRSQQGTICSFRHTCITADIDSRGVHLALYPSYKYSRWSLLSDGHLKLDSTAFCFQFHSKAQRAFLLPCSEVVSSSSDSIVRLIELDSMEPVELESSERQFGSQAINLPGARNWQQRTDNIARKYEHGVNVVILANFEGQGSKLHCLAPSTTLPGTLRLLPCDFTSRFEFLRFRNSMICLNSVPPVECLMGNPKKLHRTVGLARSFSETAPPQGRWALNADGQMQLVDTNFCLALNHDPSSSSIIGLNACSEERSLTFSFANPLTMSNLTTADDWLLDHSTADLSTNLVYMYRANEQFMDVFWKNREDINPQCYSLEDVHIKHLNATTDTVMCEFVHKSDASAPILKSSVVLAWNSLASGSIVCELPRNMNPADFIPRVTFNNVVYQSPSALRTLPLAKRQEEKHTFCSCLVLWQHWDYLLEYLRFYTDVHELGHTIVMSQDTETIEAVNWLKNLYSIEVVYWPARGSQTALLAHCSLIAKPNCQWVSQWDIDEFAYPDAIAPRLKQTRESIAVLGMTRNQFQMPQNEVIFGNLPGGVIRNYLCETRDGQAKSIVRLMDGDDFSYFNNVHGWCVQGRSSQSFITTNLAHYKFGSWSSYRLRLWRNVVFAEMRSVKIDLNHPAAEYLKDISECSTNASNTIMRDLFWTGLSYKQPQLSPRNAILVTGSFGDAHFFPRLSQAWAGGEAVSPVVFSANLALKSSLSEISPAPRFGKVVHLVADPLRSIQRLADQTDWTKATAVLPVTASFAKLPALTKALYYWVAVNQLLEMYVDLTLRVDQLHILSHDPTLRFLANLRPREIRSIQAGEFTAQATTWGQLAEADVFIARIACEIATRQGYPCQAFRE